MLFLPRSVTMAGRTVVQTCAVSAATLRPFHSQRSVGLIAGWVNTKPERQICEPSTINTHFMHCGMNSLLLGSLRLREANIRSVHSMSCSCKLLHTQTTMNYIGFGPDLNLCSGVLKYDRNIDCQRLRLQHTDCQGQSESSVGADLNIDTEEDLSRVTDDVVKKALQRDVMVKSVPMSTIKRLIVDLFNCGFSVKDIVSLLANHPKYILNHHKTTSVAHMLLEHGLALDQTVTILQDSAAFILQITDEDMMTITDTLRQAGFDEKSVASVLSENPAILSTPLASLSEKISALQQLFKVKDVLTLALEFPQVLTQDWEKNKAKFEYVFGEMKVTQKQMVYASLFRYPLMHIETRHAFLVRAGLFDMSKRREGEKSPNPSLDKIISTSDKEFCRKFGGFDVKEYRAFSQLYKKERAQLRDGDSDDDDDDVDERD